jgi:hypothetical protein
VSSAGACEWSPLTATAMPRRVHAAMSMRKTLACLADQAEFGHAFEQRVIDHGSLPHRDQRLCAA